MWLLMSRIDTTVSGGQVVDPILGADPLGMLCFSANHFAAQFMKRDRTESSQAAGPAQGANNSSAVNGYDAYFGTYMVEEESGTLRVRLEGAITPANTGSAFERHIEIHGQQLIIRLATNASDGTPITRTLTFSRLP